MSRHAELMSTMVVRVCSTSSILKNSCAFGTMLSQKEEDTFSPIHFLAGFYPGDNYSKSFKNFTILTDVLIFIVLSTTVLQLLTSPSEHKESLSVSFVVCISYSLALYYSVCFRLQHLRISQLHLLLRKTRLSLQQILGEPSVTEALQSDLKYSNFYVYFGTFASLMSALLFSIQPILRHAAVFGSDGSRRLQIDIWCPFDVQTPVVFEVVVLVQFFTVFWVALRFFSNDSFFMYQFRTNITFFKLLTAFSSSVVRPYTTYSFSSDTVGIKYPKCGNKWNLNLLYPILEEATVDDDNHQTCPYSGNVALNGEWNIQAKQQLHLFIKNHQLILRYVGKVHSMPIAMITIEQIVIINSIKCVCVCVCDLLSIIK